MVTHIVALQNGEHYAVVIGDDVLGKDRILHAVEISIEEQARIITSDGEDFEMPMDDDSYGLAFALDMIRSAGNLESFAINGQPTNYVWAKGQYVSELTEEMVRTGAHKDLPNGEYAEVFPHDPEGTAYTVRRCYMGVVQWSNTWGPENNNTPETARQWAYWEATGLGADGWLHGLHGEN